VKRTEAGLGLAALGLGVVLLWTVGQVSSPASPVGSSADSALNVGTPKLFATTTDRDSRSVASADDIAGADQASQACPDLEALLAERGARIASADLAAVDEWNPTCAALAARFDGHCRAALAACGAQATRDACQRLAAWSLIAAGEPPYEGLEPDIDSHRLLWDWADSRLPPPCQDANSAQLESEVAVHRGEVARIASECLAVLGNADDRAQLAQWLHTDPLERVARDGLIRASQSDAVEPVLAALEFGGAVTTHAALVLLAWWDRGTPALAEHERARAVEASEAAWREAELHGGEPVAHLLLQRLDPERSARAWRERLNSGRLQGGELNNAVRALLRSGSDADTDRVAGLLESPREEERLAAARGIVWNSAGAEPISPLVQRSQQVLADISRGSADAATRRLALQGSTARDGLRGRLALEALAKDDDAGVRLAAVGCLGLEPQESPAVRARLERAAASDPSAAVRKAAAALLHRIGTAGTEALGN
jgi:hypothetical protein